MQLKAPDDTVIPIRFAQLAIPSLSTPSLVTIGFPGDGDDPRIDAVLATVRPLL